MPSIAPLVRPREYFSSTLDPLHRGSLVFVAYFVSVVVLVVFTIELLLNRLIGAPPGVRSQVYGYLIPFILLSLLVFTVAWLVVAAVMHVIGGAAGDGEFLDALGLAGWVRCSSRSSCELC